LERHQKKCGKREEKPWLLSQQWYNAAAVFEGKPIIGIAGGIGSGKTFVANVFGEEGCLVINSDDMVRRVYKDETVKHTLKQWWGKMIFDPNGEIDRPAVARKIFNMPSERQRLEKLVHPIVNQNRERMMNAAAADPAIKGYVWDTPLLFETKLDQHCDAVVFVDSPLEDRLARVRSERGWGPDELEAREKSQLPLDKKRELSHYSIANPADAGDADRVRVQVKDVLSRVLATIASPA
jgi:dephospho-CoA kinase